MPTKKEDDANYWNGRRARLLTPSPDPQPNPALLPSEDAAAYAELVDAYYRRFRPARPEERGYVDDIVHCEWTLRRLQRTATELNNYVHENCGHTHADYPLGQPTAEKPKVFNALEWRAVSTRKALKQAFAALRELREQPIPDLASDPSHATLSLVRDEQTQS